MRVRSLRVQGFRNLRLESLSVTSLSVLVVGENAQGKTNLLEALAAAVTGGSFRLGSDKGLLGAGEATASVAADLLMDDGSVRRSEAVWTVDAPGGWGRQLRLDGVKVRPEAVTPILPTVIFSPEDIDLIRLSPGYRRRFLDQAISATNPAYYRELSDYTRIVKQRNQLLLLVKQGRIPADELDTWDEQLAVAGAGLVSVRRQFVVDLARRTASLYESLFGAQGGQLELRYLPSLGEEAPRNYLEKLQSVRSLDVVRATTTKGPHRDDIGFWLGGQDVRLVASRGEFRSIVMALKIAEGAAVAERTRETPVYFLDDVFSELDASRGAAIAAELASAQVFLTTNDATVASFFSSPQVLVMTAGRVVERAVVG